MKKSIIAAAALLAMSGAALANSFDVNSMPLGSFKPALDDGATGSTGAKKVFKREIMRDGAPMIQYYTLAKDGSAIVISEEAN